MKMKIKVVQLVVEKNIHRNLGKILHALLDAGSNEWVVFPEAILSGYYPQEEIYTSGLDWELIQNSFLEIENTVRLKRCHCIFGTAFWSEGQWRNAVLTYSYQKEPVRYNKIQLSKLDRRHFHPGNMLQIQELDQVKFGIQACREIIFPQQWSVLKNAGAKIIFHINNAIHPLDALWKHLFIARAIEQSIFVVSVNNAGHPQQLASYIINPKGEIIGETQIQKEQSIRVELDLSQVIDDLEKREDY
jgi:predicted amidohydrolase